MSRRTKNSGRAPRWQLEKKAHPRLKSVHREAVAGRAAQGMGRGGHPGGTKSGGGCGGRVQGGMRGRDRGGGRNAPVR